jgi:hypothetical protein
MLRGFLMSMKSWIVGFARKFLRCRPMPVILDVGLYSFIRARSEEKAPFGLKTMDF